MCLGYTGQTKFAEPQAVVHVVLGKGGATNCGGIGQTFFRLFIFIVEVVLDEFVVVLLVTVVEKVAVAAGGVVDVVCMLLLLLLVLSLILL